MDVKNAENKSRKISERILDFRNYFRICSSGAECLCVCVLYIFWLKKDSDGSVEGKLFFCLFASFLAQRHDD